MSKKVGDKETEKSKPTGKEITTQNKLQKFIRGAKNVGKWVQYGLFWTMLPLIAVVVPPWIIGYPINLTEIIPDYILMVFAVSVNLMSNKADFPTEIVEKHGIAYACVFATAIVGFVSMAVLGSIYFGFCSPFVSEDFITEFLSSGIKFTWICRISVFFLIADAVLGVFLKILEVHYHVSGDGADTTMAQKNDPQNINK